MKLHLNSNDNLVWSAHIEQLKKNLNVVRKMYIQLSQCQSHREYFYGKPQAKLQTHCEYNLQFKTNYFLKYSKD